MQLLPPPNPLLVPSIDLSHPRWILFIWQFNKNFQQGHETILYLENCRVTLGPTQEVMINDSCARSLTSVVDGVGGQHHASANLCKRDPVPIVYGAGWGPGPVWMTAENLAPTGI